MPLHAMVDDGGAGAGADEAGERHHHRDQRERRPEPGDREPHRPGTKKPATIANGSTETSTPRVRSRISRVRPYGAVTISDSNGSSCGP